MQAGKVDVPNTCKVCGANLSSDDAETCSDACAHSLRRCRVARAIISAAPGDRAIMHHDGDGRVDDLLILKQSHPYFNIEAIGSLPEIARIRAKIASGRVEPCGESCPGWAVFNADSDPILDVCIECWSGAADPLTLDEVEALPEAEHELALAIAAAEVETDAETLVYKHPRVTVPCDCGCTVFQVQGQRERCSACAMERPYECHCDVPGSCEICKSVDLLTLAKRLRDELWSLKDELDDARHAGLMNVIEEADEIIAAHDEEAKISDQPDSRDSSIFVAVLAAMDRAEEINGPEGDDYRRLMRAIEVEARNRRHCYDDMQKG